MPIITIPWENIPKTRSHGWEWRDLRSAIIAKQALLAAFGEEARIRPWQMTQAFKHSARDCVLPQARCHHNRNSLAINLLEAGASLEEVGALLGHRHRTTTEHYIRWRKVALRKILKMREAKK